MSIFQDSHFAIGSGHTVCQDYALDSQNVNSNNDLHVAIVSDGCSGSRNSDFGSRLLSKAAERELYFLPEIPVRTGDETEKNRLADRIIQHADQTRYSMLGLEPSCLDATLLSLRYDGNKPEKGFSGFTFGDGFVIAKAADGTLYVMEMTYKDNHPEYLTYRLSKDRHAEFKALDNEKSLKRTIIRPNGDRETVSWLMDNANHESWWFGIEDFLVVAIVSDGLGSFYSMPNGNPEPVDPLDIIPDLMNYKSYDPDFVLKRTKRWLKNLAAKGILHYDDFGIAAISVINEPS